MPASANLWRAGEFALLSLGTYCEHVSARLRSRRAYDVADKSHVGVNGQNYLTAGVARRTAAPRRPQFIIDSEVAPIPERPQGGLGS